MKSMRFVIFGAPGAGKGTYATRLQEILGIAAISTGDLFRDAIAKGTELGKKVKGYLDSGALVPDDVVLEVLKERLSQPDASKGFILDGYPRTLKQAEDLESITNIDAVINIIVPDWIIVERLSTRRVCEKCGAVYNIKHLKPKVEGVCDKCGGKLIQRDDDNPDVIKKRLRVYEETTKPLLDYLRTRFHVLDVEYNFKSADVDPDVMVQKILDVLKAEFPEKFK